MKFQTVLHKKKAKKQHTVLHVCHQSAQATLGIVGLQIYANNVAAEALLSFTRSRKIKPQHREK